MLAAVREDFSRIPGVEPLTISFDEPSAFQVLAGQADWTLVIAPEFAGILAERCRWVEAAGGRLLGPASAAVRLAADKLLLAGHLERCDIPTPRTQLLADFLSQRHAAFPVVCKPRYGAGSQATVRARDPRELPALCPGSPDSLVIQPFVPGLAVSVAFLIGPRQTMPLLPCRQDVSPDGRFHYLGGSLPLPPALAERARRLARRAVECVEGLRGYVGVDLVLGEQADGSRDVVIEINPRLTTSYVGLRALAVTNLAEAMLAVAVDRDIPPLVWRAGRVRFRADGTVCFTEALDDAAEFGL
jgi:predicted ATP-grasp superfamily ATP-dependent carboligase